MITAEQLCIYTGCKPVDAQRFEKPISDALRQFEITDRHSIAAFLATITVESARLSKTEEDLYYRSAERLVMIYPRAFKTIADALPYVGNPKSLSVKLYGGYHGRGLIQLTWKRNYEKAAKELTYDYVNVPTLVSEPKHAALTAAWYWVDSGCDNAAQDGDMNEVTVLVNGPRKLHLAERVAAYDRIISRL